MVTKFYFGTKEFYFTHVTTAWYLSIVVSDVSPSRLRSFFAITQTVDISPGGSENIEISFLPFLPGTCQCALILSDDSVGEILYLINGSSQLPLPEEIPMLNNSSGNICCIPSISQSVRTDLYGFIP